MPERFVDRSGTAWAAAYTYAVQMAFSTAPSPLYVLYARRDQFSSLMITLIYAAYAVGVLASLLLISHRSDVHGRRPHLLAAVALTVQSDLVFLVWPTLAGLFIARVLFGVATGLTMATVTAYITELFRARFPHGSPARAQLIVAAVNLGGLGVGAGMTGLLAQYVPDPLTIPYLVLLAMLLVATIGLVLAPETRPRTRPLPAYHPQRISISRRCPPAVLRLLDGNLLCVCHPRRVHRTRRHVPGHSRARALARAGRRSNLHRLRRRRRPRRRDQLLADQAPARCWPGAGPHGLGVDRGRRMAPRAQPRRVPDRRRVGPRCSRAPWARWWGSPLTKSFGETLAGDYLSAYIGLSIPAIGVGIALQSLTPRTTLLAFAIAVSAGLLAASRILLKHRRPNGGKMLRPLRLEAELQAAVEQRAEPNT